MFPPDQLYVLMAAENAGIALEDYKVRRAFIQSMCVLSLYHPTSFLMLIQFSSVEEALSVVSQVAGALAMGEAVSMLSTM